jgi:alginate O-acetyltransferase complex protein AlgJ
VLVGRDGWLFTTEEFEPRAAAALRIDLQEVREAKAELNRLGVNLVIALVPAKARVYPERLGRYALPGKLSGRYRELLVRLADLGIPAPDLLGPLQAGKQRGQVFLRTDTHWTPLGAEIAAEALAPELEKLLSEAGSPRARFETRPEGEREYRGDLLNFIPLGPFAERWGPRPDRVRENVTSSVDAEETELFAQPLIPVVLVGTSYSAGALWNLEGALKAAASADVLNVSELGQGALSPMRKLLQGSVLAEVQGKVVVWEIPERYFTLPLSAYE